MDIKKEAKIQLHPFMALSKNLIDCFCVIGYKEKDLRDISPNFSEKKLELSLISTIIADSSFNINIRDIIDKVYPDKPNIIKNINKDIITIINTSEIKESNSSIVFNTCVKTNVDEKEPQPERLFYSGYALRFYELFIDHGNEYYVTKAFLIISQYPFFTQYYNL